MFNHLMYAAPAIGVMIALAAVFGTVIKMFWKVISIGLGTTFCIIAFLNVTGRTLPGPDGISSLAAGLAKITADPGMDGTTANSAPAASSDDIPASSADAESSDDGTIAGFSNEKSDFVKSCVEEGENNKDECIDLWSEKQYEGTKYDYTPPAPDKSAVAPVSVSDGE